MKKRTGEIVSRKNREKRRGGTREPKKEANNSESGFSDWQSFRAALKKRLPWVVWALVVFVVAQVLMWFPLLKVVSYEFSFVMSGVLAVAGIHLGACSARRSAWASESSVTGVLGESDVNGAPGRVRRLSRVYWGAVWPVGLLWFLALDGGMAYAAVSHNCSTFLGLAFYLILPGVTVLISAAVGVFWGLLIPRKVWPVLGGVGTIGLSALFGLYKFYSRPPVCIYDPFFGFFSGNFYDELLLLELPLIAARVFHLAAAFSLLVTALLFLDTNPGKLRLRLSARRGSGLIWAVVLFCWLFTGGIYLSRGALGFSLDEDHLAEKLGGRVDTPNFVIHYDKETIDGDDARKLAMDAEFRHFQLLNFLGKAPVGRVKVFVFGSSLQKKRLMGAHQVEMAKPWRREVYITAGGFPHPVLKHELVHVFAASFGDQVFGVAVRWLRLWSFLPWPAFNPGLIEGVAVAADWSGDGLTPHQRVRAMIELGLNPPLQAVMGLSFFSSAAVRSYSIAGSFCRFLIDVYGAEKFRELFGSGGDFYGVYGRSLKSLGKSWIRFVRRVDLSEEEKDLAERRLSQRSVFQRKCIHKIASLRHKAQKLPAKEAVRLYEKICRLDPLNFGNLFRKLLYEYHAGLYRDSWGTAGELLAREGLPKALKAPAYRVLGNIEWRRGDLEKAGKLFDKALSFPVSRSMRRDLIARKHAVEDGRFEPVLRGLLLRGRYAAFYSLNQIINQYPDWGLGHYLRGSIAIQRGHHGVGADSLRRALGLELPHELFKLEAHRRLGKALFLDGQYREARAVFFRLDKDKYRESIRVSARDWMERCSWMDAQKLRDKVFVR